MSITKFYLAALLVCLLSCKESGKHKATEKQAQAILKESTPAIADTTKDKQEIQTLVRNLLAWAEHSQKVPDLLPFVVNRQDSTVTGFDLSKLKGIDDSLRAAGFFSEEFINNYNKIIQVLDTKMKEKKIAPFPTGEIPPFGFDTDSDPWCDCQDVPYDHPDAYSFVDVHITQLNNERGKMYWTWGSLPKGTSPDWATVAYKFNVVKVGGKWKISYLQAFDIKRA